MKNVGSKVRTVVFVGGCIVAGLVAMPGYAVAKGVVQDVFITNTATDPVPVTPQGTTQIAGTVTVANPTREITGTVTVANPTPVPAAPIPVQQTFSEKPITRAAPFASGILYEVPQGKVLTVEYFQAHWLFSGVALRQASLRVGCTPPPEGTIDAMQVFLPDQDAGIGYHVVGGPVKIIVPGGSCLTYDVGANYADIDEDTTLYMYGGFSGYLTDAPPAP
jgi:hypothetical protein